MQQREYMWDNMKALLIYFVVSAHALGVCEIKDYAIPARAMDMFIYSFHMAAFIFVSGFFAKRYCVNGKIRPEKAATLFAYYAVFQLLFMGIRYLMHIKVGTLSFFNPCRGLWYLLALFFLYLLTPICEKLPAWFVISATVVFAMLIANDEKASQYMTIMRFSAFAPFYFIGYYLNGDTVKKIRSWKWYARIPLGLACFAASVSMWIFNMDYPWKKLFYGKNNNIKLHLGFWEGSALRIYVMIIALMMIAALVLLIPEKKSIIAKIGQNSLQIFVLHMILKITLFDSNLVHFTIDSNRAFLFIMAISLAITIILSLKPFSYPFKWIQMGVKKLYSIKDK